MKKREIQMILKDKYILSDPMGSGGNSVVYEAKDIKNNSTVALKVLISCDSENYKEKRGRFVIETKKVQDLCRGFDGIIPIIDYEIPDDLTALHWYTMPIAVTISKHLDGLKGNDRIPSVVDSVIALSKTLEKLHALNIVHRDIKPSNLYYYNGNYCFADFGLVDYPEKENLTHTGEQIGAKATIAPEMKQDAKHADGKAADIYSLAKTLWMLLTKSNYGFDGIYNPDSNEMGLQKAFPETHLIELDQLLLDCTSDVPKSRPTLSEFIARLEDYIEVTADFERTVDSEWAEIQKILFNSCTPERAVWETREAILYILNLLGKYPNINHAFFPTGGGLDLHYAEIAGEKGCLKLMLGARIVIKPAALIMESIEGSSKWSYFFLVLDTLLPSGLSPLDMDISECVTEDIPGHYVSRLCGIYKHYEDGRPLPETAQVVERYLSGSFCIFSKRSVYNQIMGTYDARHNKMDSHLFRKYVTKMKHNYERYGLEAIRAYYDKDPFRDRQSQNESELKQKLYSDEMEKWRRKSEEILLHENLNDLINITSTPDKYLQYYISIERESFGEELRLKR